MKKKSSKSTSGAEGADTQEVTSSSKESVTIAKANIKEVVVPIEGLTGYCPNKFSKTARETMEARQRAGSTAKSKRVRAPKEFEKLYKESMFVGTDGKYGIPCTAFRAACISACRLVGFKMTIAKLAIWVVGDTIDRDDIGRSLVHLNGKPTMQITPAPNADGSMDLRAKAIFLPWSAKPRFQFDADMFTATDIFNLIERVGLQVGIGDGRNDSPNCAGIGLGSFKIAG